MIETIMGGMTLKAGEKIVENVASKLTEKKSPFPDSDRPTENNMELPKLKASDKLSEIKQFSDSEIGGAKFETGKKVVENVASNLIEKKSPFPDSVRPIEGIMELPKLIDSDKLSEIKQFIGSDNNIRGSEKLQLKSDAKENEDSDCKNNKENSEYPSTYEERMQQTPKKDSERGDWEKDRGESKFIPNDPAIKDILKKYGLDGIEYKDGIPDFSGVSEATVKIDNMTENRAENFKECDEKCAEQWNNEARDGRTDWTARDVAQWRKENGYTWHERNDMQTCDLIPSKVNDYFGHLGGISECKKRDGSNAGGGFDE